MGPKLQINNRIPTKVTPATVDLKYQNEKLFKNLNVIYDERKNREDGYWSSSSSSDEDEEEDIETIKKMEKKRNKNKIVAANPIATTKEESYEEYTKRMAREEWLWATGQLGVHPQPTFSSTLKKEVSTSPATVSASNTTSETKSAVTHKGEQTPASKNTSQVKDHPLSTKEDKNIASDNSGNSGNGNAMDDTFLTCPKDTVRNVTGAHLLRPQTYRSTNEEYLKLLSLLADPASIKDREIKLPDVSDDGVKETHEVTRRSEVCHVKDNKKETKSSSDSPIDMNTSKPTNSYLSLERIEQLEFDRLKNEWLERNGDEQFIADDVWRQARKMAADKFFDQQHCSADGDDVMGVSEFLIMHKQQQKKFDDDRAAEERFTMAVEALEALVVSRPFIDKVRSFLHDNHVIMITTKPSREKGEYSHDDYAVYQRYVDAMEGLVMDTLRSAVGRKYFNEEEFFDNLFEPRKTTSLEDGAPDDTLSFEAWEALLSILQFQSFLDLMDEYIATVYGFDDLILNESSLGAPKVASKRGLPTRKAVGAIGTSPFSLGLEDGVTSVPANAPHTTGGLFSPSIPIDSDSSHSPKVMGATKAVLESNCTVQVDDRLPRSAGPSIGRPQLPSLECGSSASSNIPLRHVTDASRGRRVIGSSTSRRKLFENREGGKA